MRHWFSRFMLAGAAVLSIAQLARAQFQTPASLLVFAEFDSRPGHITLLTITNTSATDTLRVYVGFVEEGTCGRDDVTKVLTPQDTRTLNAAVEFGLATRGYVVAIVQAPNGHAISANQLVGCYTHIDAVRARTYTLNAIGFHAIPAAGADTDVNNNGLRDFNGIEYEQIPDRMVIPRFVGQNPGDDGEVILIGLTGGFEFDTVVKFNVFNDNRMQFSTFYLFHCWDRPDLTSLSAVFTNAFLHVSGEDPAESYLGKETGWFTVDGDIAASTHTSFQDPAILAVYTSSFERGFELPFGDGQLQSNGAFWGSDVFGN